MEPERKENVNKATACHAASIAITTTKDSNITDCQNAPIGHHSAITI
jgi:hypothetical protein